MTCKHAPRNCGAIDPLLRVDVFARLLEALGDLLRVAVYAERLGVIAQEQARCQIERLHLGWAEAGEDGQFGILVKTDAAALRWQTLELERVAIIAAIRAAAKKATGAQK